ncbi:tetratricopeptide repeat protein [Noviherbaspirillum aridicola]|uniref:Tetratricopeptide repeat protein n=1 Tax=Noviherbaspirillum aridicola TaxID=2849687 RepID=A0ABQ4PZH2_9BURK|nr:tetratricopeptide repeat protein [Noviherbaspirillum aridicola]GIZ50225.1 hypothetical protein NCCP691_02390 [Noviherbaspirillum aridicola]
MSAPSTFRADQAIVHARQLIRTGDLAAAERCYRQILAAEPWHAEALYRLALLLQQGGRHDEALHLLGSALAVQPDNPLLHAAQAASLAAGKRLLDALESMATAACLHPGSRDLLYNTGLLFAELCCPAQAETIALALLKDRPDWPAAHFLLVRALTGQDADPARIAAEYDFLIKADPLNPALRFARGLQQLREGNYREGWEAQEWRWEIEPVRSARVVSDRPRWAGGPLAGRRLLVMGEQGYGDILQFSRYLPLLMERGARVTLMLHRERAGLARLLGRIEGLEIALAPETLPPHDLYCPLASLPWVFDTRVEEMPPPVRFSLDSADVAGWQARLLGLPRPWIGVCWAGSPDHDHDIRRSLPLATDGDCRLRRLRHDERVGAVAASLADACGIPAIGAAAARDALARAPSMQPFLEHCPGSFISLQVGPAAAEIDDLPDALRERIASPLRAAHDFYDTACILACLDAVVSVDTSAAHLAGSLGCPVTVIKPAAPEWRWIERDGSALWYPGMRLVSQEQLACAPADIASWAVASAGANQRTSGTRTHPTEIHFRFRPEFT